MGTFHVNGDISTNGNIKINALNNVTTASKLAAFVENDSQKGFGYVNLSDITVGAASKLATARTISLTGFVTGSGSFDGSGNLSIATTASQSYLPLAGGTMTGSITLSKGTSIKDYNNMPMLEFRGSDSDGSGIRVGDYNARMVLLTQNDDVYHYRKGITADSIMLDSYNFTTYTVKKDGTGATGTWGISINGTATKATQDASGNVITSTYATKTELNDKVPTSRTINGVSLTSDITFNYAGSSSVGGVANSAKSLTKAAYITTAEDMDAFLADGEMQYATFKLAEDNGLGFASNDGMLISIPWNDSRYGAQIAIDDSSGLPVSVRMKSTTWSNWKKLLDSSNFTSFVTPASIGAVSTSRTINSKALSANITLTAADVGADASGSANTALTNAKSYTDTKVAAIVDSAPETLNTLNELAAALGDNPNFATSIATQIGNKANTSDLTNHINNKTNPHAVTAAQTGALATSGGTLTGALYLTSGVHYGTTLPSDATAGRIFFKKIS